MIRTSTHAVAAFALLITGGFVYAGPLAPPAGAVTSTFKTLTEVEPRTAINAANTPGDADSLFKITQPGSYYLTGNIQGVVGRHGIEIAAGGVTLDLNGFDLVGAAAMGVFDGVSVTVESLTDIVVVNGSVRNWGDEGVDLAAHAPINCRVDGVRASGNDGNGIAVGTGGTVSNCSASSNTGTGIFASTGSAVSNCTASSNTGDGISVGNGSTVSNCTACANTDDGIHTSNGCTISNCTSFANTDDGIDIGYGSTVSNCTAYLSTDDGIQCTSQCTITGNTCADNGIGDGAGIHATGDDNRIEGNNCTAADRGIDVDAAGNVIIRNICAGNATNWTIAANNVFGAIVDRTAPASAAVNGNAAAATTGTSDPNANITY